MSPSINNTSESSYENLKTFQKCCSPFQGVVLIPQSLHPGNIIRVPLLKDGSCVDFGRLIDKPEKSEKSTTQTVFAGSNSKRKLYYTAEFLNNTLGGIIRVKSKVVSRQHCRFFRTTGPKCFIQDLKSSSGTFINGTRLSAIGEESSLCELVDGDLLQLGEDYDQSGIIHECLRFKVLVTFGHDDRDLTMHNGIQEIHDTLYEFFNRSHLTLNSDPTILANHVRKEVMIDFEQFWSNFACNLPSSIFKPSILSNQPSIKSPILSRLIQTPSPAASAISTISTTNIDRPHSTLPESSHATLHLISGMLL